MALSLEAAAQGRAAPVRIDGFEDTRRWSAQPAEGVGMTLQSDRGVRERSLRLDFTFSGGGWAVARRAIDLELPENYQLRFWVRGAARPNHLELKLIDETGENVWWHVRRDFEFPSEWTQVTVRRRDVRFAWGPKGGGEIRRVAAIEFAVTAGQGGTGSVWLDELELVPLPVPSATPETPVARASSAVPGHPPSAVLDSLPATGWRSLPGAKPQWLDVDLGGVRELGGLMLEWDGEHFARRFAIDASRDGRSWTTLASRSNSDGGRDWIWLPDATARRLRLRLLESASRRGFALRTLETKPPEWAPSRADFLHQVALDSPRGSYPRGLSGEQVYWAVVGVNGDPREVLLSEDGALESGRGGFSIEPIVEIGESRVSWSGVEISHGLPEGDLPIPWVRWRHPEFELEIAALAEGRAGASRVLARYRIANLRRDSLRLTLRLAVRPFQVNPPQQALNLVGGVARVRALERRGRMLRVNGEPRIWSLTAPTTFRAASYQDGDVAIRRAVAAPVVDTLTDPFEAASGELDYEIALAQGQRTSLALAIGLYPDSSRVGAGAQLPSFATGDLGLELWWDGRVRAATALWRDALDRVEVRLPGAAAPLAHTLRSNLAWILVNRDGPAIQPGSRSYERSWIRDGALTSTALLRLGHAEPVREFLEWFADHQYASGKVPCCVDARGADPVAEHDSHGELIYLAAEYARHTQDYETLARLWPHVAAAAAHLDSLRLTHRTPEYETAEKRAYYGLLPPSISHEGYSAKPMHSYWDDLFALRGFKDAAWIAGVLGRRADQVGWERIRNEFRHDLVASFQQAMALHRIDWLPGCVELGDFDATSTTIALSPVDAVADLPPAALRRTFEKYWTFFQTRRDSARSWDAYTPYELRNVGAFVRLGWRERARELLDWFMTHRRPAAWNQWAEVVGREARVPRFLGDMPHTWVGSDYIRSLLDLFAYERESDSALVVAAGVPESWLRAGEVALTGLSTHYGPIDLKLSQRDGTARVRIAGNLRIPRGGIVVRSPLAVRPRDVRVDGRRVRAANEVVVRRLPAIVDFR
jgi:hypothetical protein